MTEKTVKATLILSCDVKLNDLIKKQAEEDCNITLSDEETAQRILFAFLNPKIEALNDDDGLVSGYWDFVCEFHGRLNNFSLQDDN